MPSDQRIADLEANALHTSDRFRLYQARVHGSQPTSIVKLRELKRDAELAERLLSHARAEARLLSQARAEAGTKHS